MDQLAAGIHMPACPSGRGGNSPKRKLFSAVARPKTGVTEFSHPLNQSSQARCQLWLFSLLVNPRREQMHF
jgi:hypothetical protein